MPDTSHLPRQNPHSTPPGDSYATDHAREWQAHLDAGRIGTRTPATRAQFARHVRNEIVLCGYRLGPSFD